MQQPAPGMYIKVENFKKNNLVLLRIRNYSVVETFREKCMIQRMRTIVKFKGFKKLFLC